MHYGITRAGQSVERFPIGSRHGPLLVEVITYGATITSIFAPARDGESENVVLCYDDLAAYEAPPPPRAYYGATIGRYANRIAGGCFTLDNQPHYLSQNEGMQTLHGGARGFDAVVWRIESATPRELRLAHRSPDGDQGFPGALEASVTFAVDEDTLTISYHARCDRDTVVNLTNHSYFNLSPRSNAQAAEHVLQLFADAYTPVDPQLIPTGEIAPVAGTRFDFRSPRVVGAQPFDANWVLRQGDGELHNALMLGHPASGRVMQVQTTQPGVQIYTGNAKGVAIETQHFPDSPNHPNFPSTVLRAGDDFTSTTRYRFSHS